MDDLEVVFNRLKKSTYESVVASLKAAAGTAHIPWTVDAQTFDIHLPYRYHSIVTGNGWTVKEFEGTLRDYYDK